MISSDLTEQCADSPLGTVFTVHAAYMRYKILDVPPWYECILLGFQVRRVAIPEELGLATSPWAAVCVAHMLGSPLSVALTRVIAATLAEW